MLLAKYVFSQKTWLISNGPQPGNFPQWGFFLKSDGVVLLSTSRGNCIKLTSQNLTPCYVSNFFTSFPSLKPMISSLSALQKDLPHCYRKDSLICFMTQSLVSITTRVFTSNYMRLSLQSLPEEQNG